MEVYTRCGCISGSRSQRKIHKLCLNNKNKLLQNGAMTAGREGQESERHNPASLIHRPEVRGQNHQYVGRVGFLCVLTGLQLRPQLSGPALHQEGPAVSGSPQLLPGCSKHTTSFDIWTRPRWGGRVSLASVQKGQRFIQRCLPMHCLSTLCFSHKITQFNG